MFRSTSAKVRAVAGFAASIALLSAGAAFAQGNQEQVPRHRTPDVQNQGTTGPVDDTPERRGRLQNMASEREKQRQEEQQAKQRLMQQLRQRNRHLQQDVQRIMQLSLNLNQRIDRNEPASSHDTAREAAKLEKVAHDVRTTMANRRQHHPDEKDVAGPAQPDIREQSKECMLLAYQLKTQMDRELDPRNQDLVSVAGLKQGDKQQANARPSPAMQTAEKIEVLSYRLKHAAP
jgi:DNA-binding cell septation regulator SpoVG